MSALTLEFPSDHGPVPEEHPVLISGVEVDIDLKHGLIGEDFLNMVLSLEILHGYVKVGTQLAVASIVPLFLTVCIDILKWLAVKVMSVEFKWVVLLLSVLSLVPVRIFGDLSGVKTRFVLDFGVSYGEIVSFVFA